MSEQGITKEWNERYVCYAMAHGRTPEEMLAHDKESYPGACMAEYMIWNSTQLQEWKRINNYTGSMTTEAHAAYDKWLSAKVGLTALAA